MAGSRGQPEWRDDGNQVGCIDLHRKKCGATPWRGNGLGVTPEWDLEKIGRFFKKLSNDSHYV